MFLILISISINIFLNLKSKNIGEALFSHNGLAGLICYGSCTVAILFLILLKKNIFSPVYIVTTVILPLVLIFFSLPLGNIINHNQKNNHSSSEKFTISSAIFDMIDILLSYFTNTLSFLRIGGLALSHAALMLVVMKFAKMAGSLSFVGSVSGPIIIILGNAFVILLEGLIVSIQALRLIYYEVFSRFYQSNGRQFDPIKINYDK
jgi:V/A-type H+-transporting ATPase subunit I